VKRERGWSHLTQRQSLCDPVSRHTMALALIAVPVIVGALSLRPLAPDASTIAWVAGIVAITGAAGGWLHPPARSLRLRGALAGIIVAWGALAAAYGYVGWRRGDITGNFGLGLGLSIFTGGLPGAVLYYALVGHAVDADGQS